MLKKAVLATLLVGLIGILVAGAIIRTVDKTDNVAEARGLGQGQGRGEGNTVESAGQGAGQGRGGGQGGGYGQASGDGERQYPNYETAPEDWATYEGTVVEAPEAGVDLVIATADGEEIVVGTGPGYMEAEGFVLQAAEQVQVQGYWEDGELKAAQITRLRDGESITLRDQYGHPAWAGSGNRAAGPGGGTGEGLAQADAWLTVPGTVVSVDTSALVVQTVDGDEIVVDGRPWTFAQEQGFWAEAGDRVTLVGFDEEGTFEVGQIGNDTSGLVVQIREENGRPLWAGRGRRGG